MHGSIREPHAAADHEARDDASARNQVEHRDLLNRGRQSCGAYHDARAGVCASGF
jgi:hypothetical protein